MHTVHTAVNIFEAIENRIAVSNAGRLAPSVRPDLCAPRLCPPSLSEKTSGSDTSTFEQQVEVILPLKPAVFSFVFGIRDVAIGRECRLRGIVTLGAATTPDEARALDSVGVRVIAAGGIADPRGMRAAFQHGAQALSSPRIATGCGR